MIRSAAPPPADPPPSPVITPHQAEAIVRIVESAPHVRRRYQFFVWTQSQLQALLPHQILVCGAYQRQRRDLAFEAFHSIVLGAAVLQTLVDGQGPLLRGLLTAWIEGRGQPLQWGLARLAPAVPEGVTQELAAAGIATLLVHGVSRPQRPSEVESFFVFADGPRPSSHHVPAHAELMLPHLHATWLRVMAAEREIAPPAAPAAPRPQRAGAASAGVTERECQILAWMREGKSNQQIAEVLGISPLTVKNHVQKILRKLGASNRAQAVAEAMGRGLIEGRMP